MKKLPELPVSSRPVATTAERSNSKSQYLGGLSEPPFFFSSGSARHSRLDRQNLEGRTLTKHSLLSPNNVKVLCMSDALRSSPEIVLEHPPTEAPEPSDAELAVGYSPSFPHSIDPNAETFYSGELLRYKDAVMKERAAFIARKRKAIQDKREREERARIAKIEAAEKRQAFEAASKRGEARISLRTALAAYQEAQDQVHTLESALAQAQAHQSGWRQFGQATESGC
jgi:hypothetical protein